MKGLTGKTAIVTGGATMIGAAVVEVLRQAGGKVAVFDTDAAGAARAVARDPLTMRKAGAGAIVNFTSISSRVAQTGRWLYPVSKAALLQLTRSMAMDLAPDHIRVNSVSPGWTCSRLMDELTHGDRAKTPMWFGISRALGGLGLGGIIPVAAAPTTEYSPPARKSFNYGLMYSGTNRPGPWPPGWASPVATARLPARPARAGILAVMPR